MLYTNPAGRPPAKVRLRPAQVIDEIDVDPEDYETELRYHEVGSRLDSVEGTLVALRPPTPTPRTGTQPVMLHYAVNRPVGAVRGESDLAPILPWLQRYSRWLEDRVRLNAGVRAFLWIVKAPGRLRTDLLERYRMPPEPGSVIIADEQESGPPSPPASTPTTPPTTAAPSAG